jgi:hypothetical protein
MREDRFQKATAVGKNKFFIIFCWQMGSLSFALSALFGFQG